VPKIERFEDLLCWQAGRKLVKFVYLICETVPLNKDFETKGQLKHAALTVMNNIAEGFGRIHKRDSLRFYDYSVSSCDELQSMTYVLEDMDYLSIEKINEMRTLISNAKNLTLGFIKHLNKKP
jgi:four helix bundle protein